MQEEISENQDSEISPIQKAPFSKRKLIFFAIILVILIFLPFAFFLISRMSNQGNVPLQGNQKTFSPQAPHANDELIIKLKDSYTRVELERLNKKFTELGIVSQRKVYDSEDPRLKNFFVLKFKKGTDIKKTGQELINLPELEGVAPNYIDTIQIIPQDPFYNQLQLLWGFDKISMPQAWDSIRGSNSIIVAVVDTGIDYNHQDFSGRTIIKGPDLATCDMIESGACASPKQRDSDPIDDNSHGTHVSGVIGAVTNNNIGVSGVNWDVTLMAVKVMGKSGQGFRNDILEGIRFAADNGAKVINISLGNGAPCGFEYQTEIDYALSKGSIVVAAAGNGDNGVAVDASGFSPASCNGVITVGATTQPDTRWNLSNWGERVDISAPGHEIVSTVLNNQYQSKNGTSMAAPHVSGVVGLLLAANPGLPQDQVKSCLINSADPITTDENIGPRLNAYRALTLCTNTASIPIATNVTPSPIISPDSMPPTSKPLTPSPTTVKTYTCREDSRGSTARPGSIKIGSLMCEPNP